MKSTKASLVKQGNENMLDKMKVLVVIPARGGSKGIIKKNIKLLHGKPLIQYTIEAAQNAIYVDDIVVSTDDDEIKKVSESLCTKVISRPESLSGDDALVVDALRYTLDELEREGTMYDIVLLLEPTSPLRTSEIIDDCIKEFANNDVKNVVTFSETDLPPDRIWKLDDKGIEPYIKGANPWLPRQKLEVGYQLNGLVYALDVLNFRKMKESQSILNGKITPVITPKEISIDIDDMLDFKMIEFLMKGKE